MMNFFVQILNSYLYLIDKIYISKFISTIVAYQKYYNSVTLLHSNMIMVMPWKKTI